MVCGIVQIEDAVAPPVRVLLLEPEAQAQNEVPDGERVVVAVIHGVPHRSEAASGRNDVVVAQPEHILGVQLLSSLAPAIANIAGLVEHGLINVDDDLTLSQLLGVEYCGQLPLLFGLDRVGPDLASVDTFVREAL